MKRIINIALGLAAVVGFSSCEDFLTREPIHKFGAETYFSSKADLKTYTDGLINSYLPNYSEPAGGDMYNDLIAGKQSTNYFRQNYNWTPATQGEWSWGRLRRVNYMLQGMEKNARGKIDEATYNHYEGVARFWRAYHYFSAINTYGNVPWTTKYLQPTDEELFAGRDDREYVWSKIVEDLKFACEHVQGGGEYHTSARVYINKWVVCTFASRAALYEASFRSNYPKNPSTNEPWNNKYNSVQDLYQLAADAAKQVIDNGGFKLVSGDQYSQLFLSENLLTDEVIWGRQFGTALGATHALSRYYYSDSMGDVSSATKELVRMYLKKDGTPVTTGEVGINDEFKDRDPRLAKTVLGPGFPVKSGANTITMNVSCNHCLTGYMLVKWLYPDDSYWASGIDSNSILIYRYAEVLLNYAEAMNELGKMDKTVWDLTVGALRTRAGVANVYPTAVDTWLKEYYTKDLKYPFKSKGNEAVALEIRRERATELILEGGLRQQDLFRYGQMDLIERRGAKGEESWTGVWISDTDYANGYYMFNDTKYFINTGEKKTTEYPITTNNADMTWSLRKAEGSGYYLQYHLDLKWEDKMYVRPISQNDLNLNPNLGQNYGW